LIPGRKQNNEKTTTYITRKVKEKKIYKQHAILEDIDGEDGRIHMNLAKLDLDITKDVDVSYYLPNKEDGHKDEKISIKEFQHRMLNDKEFSENVFVVIVEGEDYEIRLSGGEMWVSSFDNNKVDLIYNQLIKRRKMSKLPFKTGGIYARKVDPKVEFKDYKETKLSNMWKIANGMEASPLCFHIIFFKKRKNRHLLGENLQSVDGNINERVWCACEKFVSGGDIFSHADSDRRFSYSSEYNKLIKIDNMSVMYRPDNDNQHVYSTCVKNFSNLDDETGEDSFDLEWKNESTGEQTSYSNFRFVPSILY
jgi:hypothetical protein